MWELTDAYEMGYEYTCSFSGLKVDTPIKGYYPVDCKDCPCYDKCLYNSKEN